MQLPLTGGTWNNFLQDLPQTWPYLATPLIAAGWRPLASAIVWLAEECRVALVLVNLLNVSDALLTRYAMRTEGAVESNPVVRAIGMPAKILVVGLLSVMLFRLRPRALTWLVVAFSGVLIWHLAGFWASPR